MGMQCSNLKPCHSKFIILHTNSIHEVSVNFCSCTRTISKYHQLLCHGLFPATQENPRTCASFSLLQQLQMLSLTSKCSMYDYYRALERLTDNSGIDRPKSKYCTLMCLNLQWRHLKLLKRAGRGHDKTGVEGTKEGELAVMCPSCPHPSINLPDNWEEVPAALKYGS